MKEDGDTLCIILFHEKDGRSDAMGIKPRVKIIDGQLCLNIDELFTNEELSIPMSNIESAFTKGSIYELDTIPDEFLRILEKGTIID